MNFNKNSKVSTIEANLLTKVLEDLEQKLTSEQIRQIAEELEISYTELKAQGLSAVCIAAFRMGGFKSYIILMKCINLVWRFLFGKGLTLAANAAIAKYVAVFTGPIGWAVTGAWTIFDAAGPAFRVTFPAVLHVIALRQNYLNRNLLK